MNFRNGVVLLLKNLHSGDLLWKLPVRLLLDGLAGIYFLFQGHFKDFFAVIKAHFSIWFRIGFWWTKRGHVHRQSRKVALFPKSLIYQYFIKKKRTYSELAD